MDRPLPATRASRLAFTLVEMLVVVAIAAVLAALLFPNLQKALQESRKTRCAGQLQQVYAGITLYAGDNDGAYITASGNGWFWCTSYSPLAPYLGGYAAMAQIVICPSVRAGRAQVPMPFATNGYPYVVNYSVITIPNGTTVPPPFHAASLTRPGNIAMMADPVTNNWGVGFGYGDPSRIGAPHLGQANVLWCDGHVTSQTPSSLVLTNMMPQ